MNINVNKVARKVEVDNRLSLRHYHRIADNLLRQASIFREEKNIVDLYIILIRFSSLLSETIPCHRDFPTLSKKVKAASKKKLIAVLDELEALKPECKRQLEELNKACAGHELDGRGSTSYGSETSSFGWHPVHKTSHSSTDVKQPAIEAPQSSWKYDKNYPQVPSSNYSQLDRQLQKLIPLPKQETVSRHSFFPNGLRGQWHGPCAEIKVQYPSNNDLKSDESLSLNQAGQHGGMGIKDDDFGAVGSTVESVLSLNDGRWSHPVEETCPTLINELREDPFQFSGVRQPSSSPVLAQVKTDFIPIPPNKVADPRPGPAKPSQDGMPHSNSYQHVHIPVYMMEDFLRLARANTEKNLETCGVLAGSLKNRVFHITTLIIPKQESTSDSRQTLNEEEIFEVQDRLSLFPLGWIHTHPSQTCFMSSVDLHTHYSYQIMLPEAIAIVMAPTDTSSPHGIFHLSDPGGVSTIRNCQVRGFHPHEEPLDGSPIYEHCSHVYMNSKLKFEVVDLR